MTENLAVHPITGEVLEHLDQLPAETLADLAFGIVERQAQLKETRTLVDRELRSRLRLKDRTSATFGDYEVAIVERRSREWDPDDTEATLRELVDDGTLTAGELTGVIQRKTEVSRTQINKIVGRLSGAPRAALERCMVWRVSSPKLEVTRSVKLIGDDTQ